MTQASDDKPVSPPPAHCCAIAPDQRAAIEGKWGPVFYLPNVAIHTHILPNGKVLFWGRRDKPEDSMDEHECTPHVWDPVTKEFFETPQPKLGNHDTKVNLFCSGHAFMPDGRLLVAGGHLQDSHGDNQASSYDYRTNSWTALPAMNNGRWYPNVIALADGSMLVTSGSYSDGIRDAPQNHVPQIFDGVSWHAMQPPLDEGDPDLFSLFPRTHVLTDGRVVFTGTNAHSLYFDPKGAGTWTPAPGREMLARDYCPSVMYDVGKVIYIGGGNDPHNGPPTDQAEIIDYNDDAPKWRKTAPMHFRRRHHNGVLLPDGAVLVVGGTQGGDFNDLSPGKPVHEAELWDPRAESWTLLARESVDRCYHATAVLLPDASVLSAGSGEGGSNPNVAHREAQIFYPPYFFRGDRPVIEKAPEDVSYGKEFSLEVGAGDVAGISWIRLPSVTHAFDQNQRINFLSFKAKGGTFKVRAPDKPGSCPPGHYMLFVLNQLGVPSHARIVHIGGYAPARKRPLAAAAKFTAPLKKRQDDLRRAKVGTPVTVGLTSTCPYGLGACWGGAHEALKKLSGVVAVEPIPNAESSTAQVHIEGELPDLEDWPKQFAATANGSYTFRGVELAIDGTVRSSRGRLELTTASGLVIKIEPLASENLLQWDKTSGKPKHASKHEMLAFDRLLLATERNADSPAQVRSVGQLIRRGTDWIQMVRTFSLND